MGRSKLQQRYYDPKRVGSYGGVAALRRVVPEQDVERWLSEQDTYTLHKPVIILYTVIVVSIYNLIVGHGDSTLWTALLSSSLGYLLPNPSLKREDGV